MEIGIDSFAGLREGEKDGSRAINELIDRINLLIKQDYTLSE